MRFLSLVFAREESVLPLKRLSFAGSFVKTGLNSGVTRLVLSVD